MYGFDFSFVVATCTISESGTQAIYRCVKQSHLKYPHLKYQISVYFHIVV